MCSFIFIVIEMNIPYFVIRISPETQSQISSSTLISQFRLTVSDEVAHKAQYEDPRMLLKE